MRLKLTLDRPGGARQDLLVTCDSATTVGDLASYLRDADPTARDGGGGSPAEVTLSVVDAAHKALDPRIPLADSPIRSGALVAIARAGESYADPTHNAVALVSMVGGPGAGGPDVPLASGPSIIGRQRGVEVRLTDSLVSRQHARINVSDHIEVIDLGSANGVEVNGALVQRATIRPTDVVRVGDTTLTVRMAQVASAEGRTDGSLVGFIRSPRLAPQFAGQRLVVPELPQPQGRQPWPMFMTIIPLLMAGVMYLATRQSSVLLMALFTPLMMLGTWWEQRRHANKVDKAALAQFRADLVDVVAEGEQRAAEEVALRLQEHPATTECLTAVRERSPLLWTRRPGDWGFLELRLGTGTLPSRSEIELPDGRRGPRELFREAREATAHLHLVSPVPIVAFPRESGGVGVAGPRSAAMAAARALIVQAASLHSPAELAIGLFGSSRTAADWDWIKWLPHVDSAQSPLDSAHLTSNESGANALLSATEAVIAERLAAERGGGGGSKIPAVLLVVESDAPAEFGRLVEVAEKGWAAGVHILWVAPEVAQLPAACRTFVDCASIEESGVGFVHHASGVYPVVTETLTAEVALACARSMAPVTDLGARADDASDLPRRVSFLALDGHEALDTQDQAVIERWQQNHSILTGPHAGPPSRREASLRATIGYAAGQLHSLDLRTDGPHALVGGTTGAGKSELLQTWILSMAASHSPQRLTFLLVDYKGGSAFADCSRLPHTVGLVTDLNTNGVRRALTSLSAELKYREEFLHERKAKDLMALEKKGVTDCPPSLVLVVDEFAALVQEVPEFVDGVVNVAQRGRSLGLHLILATQRPAGVIKDNLRANTNLRLALRVADEGDSTDVLGSADAAFFDPNLPGRAVSKTGPGRLVPFQTAYVGGHTTDSGPSAPDIVVLELTIGPGRLWEPPAPVTEAPSAPLGPTDIARIVDRINVARESAELPLPRKPWLPDLQASYDLRSPEVAASGRDDRLVFGIADEPESQSQHPVAFHPDRDGNVAIFGGGGSGKSTALRTIAVAAGLSTSRGPCHVYGLDFGARGLAMLEQLPHVGAIINAGDDERVKRLIDWLREEVDQRAIRYAAVNADSITQYRQVSGRSDEPRILVLLDGLAAFRQTYEDGWLIPWWERLVSVASDGRQVGVHLIVTADRAGALPTGLGATIQRRLVLRMADPQDYGNLGVPGDILNPLSVPGRGIWAGQEVHVGVLGAHTKHPDNPELRVPPDLGEQSRETAVMATWMTRRGVTPATPIRRLTDDIALDSLPATSEGGMTIGLSGESLEAIGMSTSGTVVVMGPPASGRTTALLTLVSAAQRIRPQGVSYLFTTDRRSPLVAAHPWTARGVGIEDSRDLLDQITAALQQHSSASEQDAPVTIVLERFADWANDAEYAIESLYKAAIAAGALIIADGEPTHFTSRYGVTALAKASRQGLLLQPESGDGDALGVELPRRLVKADFPPGRAYLAQLGRATLVQVAHNTPASPGEVSPPVGT